MNHDDNHPEKPIPTDLELEARIVALVSGEASAFEAAELERLISEKPELAIFKRRLEAVHGLVNEAIRPDKTPLVMSAERRAKLLAAIGGPVEAKPSAPGDGASAVPLPATKKTRRFDYRWMSAIAAALLVGFVAISSIPSFQLVRSYKGNQPTDNKEIAVAMPMPSSLDDEEPKAKRSQDLVQREAAYKQAIDDAVERKKARESFAGRPARQGPQPVTAASKGMAASQDGTAFRFEARDTLAGARARTDLKDAASSIAVATDQFLKDTGADNSKNLLTYTTNTEVGGLHGNIAAAAPAAKGGLVAQDLPPGAATEAHQQETDAPTVYVASGPAPVGQSSGSESAEQTIVLSPFVVNAPEQAGGAEQSKLAKMQIAGLVDGKKKSLDDGEDADKPLPPPKKEPSNEALPEVNATKEPVSTFSLHVSDVSFRLARAALARNEPMDEDSLRPEEFYNAFDYGDPTPTMAEKVSCRVEQSAHPFLQQRNLVRIAIKVPATGRDAAQPLRLTVLLDTSGSMEREDRAAIARRALQALVSLLGPNDRLTLIGFARQPRLLAESLTGDKAGQALEIVAHTPAEGGTNLDEALKLASQLARRQFEPVAQNRIVVLTDGAANLGNANPVELAKAVELLRQQGIAFDACGVGLDGLDDAMLERLTRKGSGRYYVLNSPDEADAGFARQLAGAFHPAAENVKLQVRFNPARVGNYRLIGFEQHRLREEDFRNDSVAAASLAAEEAAVAVYQVEALPQGEGELGEVYVRFRDTAAGTMVERSWTLPYDAHAAAFDRATPTMQLAGTAALLAEKMRGGEAGEAIKLGDLAPVVNKLRGQYTHEPRVQELVTMFEQLRHLAGE